MSSTEVEGLPQYFAGRRIITRDVHTAAGEIVITNNNVNGDGRGVLVEPGVRQNGAQPAFVNANDRPFEIHRVFLEVLCMNTEEDPPIPFNPTIQVAVFRALGKLIGITIEHRQPGGRLVTRREGVLSSIVDPDTWAWDWKQPYSILQNEAMTIQARNLVPTNTFTVGQDTTVPGLRVAASFQGYLLTLAPPPDRG